MPPSASRPRLRRTSFAAASAHACINRGFQPYLTYPLPKLAPPIYTYKSGTIVRAISFNCSSLWHICPYKLSKVGGAKVREDGAMRLRSCLLALLILLGMAAPRSYAGDDYPKRQIRIVVPFPAGSGPDQVARLVGQHLQDAFGQTVLIENRTGALGSIAALEVARSAPDGYTLLMGTNTTQASNVAMLKNLAYDPAKDFAPIIRTTTTAMVMLVKPDFPARDLDGFLAYARTGSRLTAGYGSGASQISIAQLQSRGGLSLIAASYRGVPQAVTDVIAGAIDLSFADFSVAIP